MSLSTVLISYLFGCAPAQDDSHNSTVNSTTDTGNTAVDTGTTTTTPTYTSVQTQYDPDRDGYLTKDNAAKLLNAIESGLIAEDAACDVAEANSNAQQYDCGEGDASVHPTQTDIPGDGIDQDCDGSDAKVADVCDGVTGVSFEAPVSAAFPESVSIAVGNVDGQPGDEILVGYSHKTGEQNGRVEIYKTSDLKKPIATLHGGDNLGSFGGIGNSVNVLTVGAHTYLLVGDSALNTSWPSKSGDGSDSGGIYVFATGASLMGDLYASSDALSLKEGNPGEILGGLKPVGDLNSDGKPEYVRPSPANQYQVEVVTVDMNGNDLEVTPVSTLSTTSYLGHLDAEDAVGVDANGDGKPDYVSVYDSNASADRGIRYFVNASSVMGGNINVYTQANLTQVVGANDYSYINYGQFLNYGGQFYFADGSANDGQGAVMVLSANLTGVVDVSSSETILNDADSKTYNEGSALVAVSNACDKGAVISQASVGAAFETAPAILNIKQVPSPASFDANFTTNDGGSIALTGSKGGAALTAIDVDGDGIAESVLAYSFGDGKAWLVKGTLTP